MTKLKILLESITIIIQDFQNYPVPLIILVNHQNFIVKDIFLHSNSYASTFFLGFIGFI
jgi:hypothetical protein